MKSSNNKGNTVSIILVILAILVAACCSDSGDILIADFESGTYGDWENEGEAFGEKPATGTLPNQQAVTGFEGGGLVNTYLGGDGSMGILTSPDFEVTHRYINFLIGGGNSEDARIDLLTGDDGFIATIGNGKDSEKLEWATFDLSDQMGEWIRIRIVDETDGDWGHILVDQIYLSNNLKAKPVVYEPVSKKLSCQDRYLNFPVSEDSGEQMVEFLVEGEKVREFTLNLSGKDPDFWVFLEISEFKNKDATIHIERFNDQGKEGFEMIHQADTFPGESNIYREVLRPQFHFSSKRGWNNDANGMVYYDGEYHLFWQHNPFGWPGGNMTWGHAVSPDMIHWTELGDALHPDELGTIFSGGAVVDHNNTSGFQTGEEKPIVCFYTSAGREGNWSREEPFTQSIAFSNDRGRTFTKYEGNPVIGHIRGGNRDPKVIWHEPTGKWVMALFIEDQEMAIFNSDDLKTWTETSRLGSFHECPELFELALDGDPGNTKWILYGASADYNIGSFDGEAFTPETEILEFNLGNAFYASQTFSDIPEEDGRRIMMAWGQVSMIGMPFNQLITFPVEITLKTTAEGIRMFAGPVKEIENIHKKKHSFGGESLEGTRSLPGVEGELFHIKADFQAGDAESFGLIVRGYKITYDAVENVIICQAPENDFNDEDFLEPQTIPVEPDNGHIDLEILVDRSYVELFVNDGRYYLPLGAYLVDQDPDIKVFSEGGKTKLEQLDIYELNSTWN